LLLFVCSGKRMEEPLIGSGSKEKGKYPKICLYPTIAAGVLGVAFLSTLIALIAVAASSSSSSCKHHSDSSSLPVPSSSSLPLPSSSAPVPSSSAPVPSSSSTPVPSSSSEPPVSSSSSEPPVSSSSSEPPVSSSSSEPPYSSSSSSQPIVFTEFTTQMLSLTCDSFGQHCVFGDVMNMSVFGPGRFCLVSEDENGTVTMNQFSTESDDSCTVCEQLGNHGNCYRLSSNDDIEFTVAGLEPLVKGVSCSDISPSLIQLIPDRKLDKCDYYTATNNAYPESLSDVVYQLLVESGTDYPVIEFVKDFQEAYASITIFATFDPNPPASEECLQPFPDVTIYDFRDGQGDVSKETSFATREIDTKTKQIAETMERRKKVRQMGHLPMELPSKIKPQLVSRNVNVRDVRDIPAEFDARQAWSGCSDTIGIITNQGICGSCWAMSSAGVLADRACIATNNNVQLSPQYMVYCGTKTFGCQGGGTLEPWDQLVEQGTVSEDCVPFTARNGACPTKCHNGKNITDEDIFRATSYVLPWANESEARVQAIQSELMEHGSLQAGFFVFSDFYSYASGVYQRTENSYMTGGHAVRLIGWGTDDDVDYWLVANSWDTDWGIDGLFKIRRGNNECNFEEEIIAGLVD